MAKTYSTPGQDPEKEAPNKKKAGVYDRPERTGPSQAVIIAVVAAILIILMVLLLRAT
jgi:hypothetical protein